VESEYGVLPESCAHIAPDPFDFAFNMRSVIQDIRSRNTEIKRALLNQEIVSGIGNIYADEALWRARIHPERLTNRLRESEIDLLLRSAKIVMRAALKKGGTSFDQLYINVNGESGYFEISLRAYGREGEPCHRCGAAIRRISFANRSSHFCPKCQPRGRKISGNRGNNSRKRRG
jgi:formamidopyrimidine-DNA glycosylase